MTTPPIAHASRFLLMSSLLGALTLALGLLLAPYAPPARTGRLIAVRDGGSGPWYTSIAAAIAAASSDPNYPDTIVVESSFQSGGFVIDRPVNLISAAGTTISAPAGKRAITIDGRGTTIGTSITIQGFTFREGDATSDTSAAPGRAGVPGCGGGVLIIGASPTLARNTIIDNKAATGAGAGRGGGVCLIDSNAVLAGNTIGQPNVGGNLAAVNGEGRGGGVYIAGGAPTLRDNIIGANSAAPSAAGYGGGVYLDHSAALVQQNSISRNEAAGQNGEAGQGGGVYVDGQAAGGAPMLIGNGITNNTAARNANGQGGGVYVKEAGATLQENVVTLNLASSKDGASGYGGGIYSAGAAPTLARNVVAENRAYSSGAGQGGGGGIWLQGSAALVAGNFIQNNSQSFSAGGNGQAIGIAGGGGWLLSNNLIARNATNAAPGNAVWVDASHGALIHNTIADNADFDEQQTPTPPSDGQVGVAISGSAVITLTNSIIAGHATGLRTMAAGARAQLTRTLFFRNGSNTDSSAGGTIASANAHSGDPLFADASGHLPNYHLSAGSPALDRGAPSGTRADLADLDGQPRASGPAPDLGAYERQLPRSTLWLPMAQR